MKERRREREGGSEREGGGGRGEREVIVLLCWVKEIKERGRVEKGREAMSERLLSKRKRER
jgi:hypothetical protein